MVGESSGSFTGCKLIKHLDITAANPAFMVDPSMGIFIDELLPFVAHVFSFLVSRLMPIEKDGKKFWGSSPILVLTHFKKNIRDYIVKIAQSAVSSGSWLKVIGSPNFGGYLPDNISNDDGKVKCLKTLIKRKDAKCKKNEDENDTFALFVKELSEERLNQPFREFQDSHRVTLRDGLISLMGCTAYNLRANARTFEDLASEYTSILFGTLLKVPVTVVDDPKGVREAPTREKMMGGNEGRAIRIAEPWIHLKTNTTADLELDVAENELLEAQSELETARMELKALEDGGVGGGGGGGGRGGRGGGRGGGGGGGGGGGRDGGGRG
jgi:uncharacterized membrane protein YgcG